MESQLSNGASAKNYWVEGWQPRAAGTGNGGKGSEVIGVKGEGTKKRPCRFRMSEHEQVFVSGIFSKPWGRGGCTHAVQHIACSLAMRPRAEQGRLCSWKK